jgi:hypothetical protein
VSRARLIPWVVVAVVAVVLLGLGVLLAVQALGLHDERGLSSERASTIQALAAAGALAGTAALVGVTAYYAWVTAKMLERGGQIITVEIKQAWVHVTGAGCVTLPLRDGVLAAPPDPEHPRFMFAVEVRNSGGAGTTVDKAAVAMEAG